MCWGWGEMGMGLAICLRLVWGLVGFLQLAPAYCNISWQALEEHWLFVFEDLTLNIGIHHHVV